MIATTISQSKHLLELSLDPATADMVYISGAPASINVIDEAYVKRDLLDEYDVLAWSLSALLGVMPKECEPDLQKTPLTGCYFVHYFADKRPYITNDHVNAVSAAVEAVTWLLESGHIKKWDDHALRNH